LIEKQQIHSLREVCTSISEMRSVNKK
jgi:hypothetical protein